MIDILIPVLGRPHNAHKVATSVERNTRAEHRLIFLCSPTDYEEMEACRNVSGAETLVVDWDPAAGDYARKINWGFSQGQSEWIFQGADDLYFHRDWDVEALAVAHSTTRRVIGTNDLHNPRVLRGTHSTHSLIARSYVEDGQVLCEDYDHQYVDNELCATSRRRGEFAFAPRSIVEHLHPYWGLAEDDPTYRKAMRETRADARLYTSRLGQGRRA